MATPPPEGMPERAEKLARRVRWLDTYRRLISVVTAAVFFVLFARELADLFGPAWSGPLTTAIAILFASALWWIVEVAFAWVTAFWETEYVHLLRDRGLPVARLLTARSRRDRPS